MRARTSEERAKRAISFDSDPELYDRARPTYPPEIYDALWQMANLPEHPTILEVGCGPGKASLDLVRKGANLTCVEYGANMAAVARQNLSEFPQTQVVNAKFEDFDPGENRFDLVFAASSWHWIDPETKYAKAASALKEGGHLAVLSSSHAYPEGYDPTFDRIQDVYQRETGSRLEWPPPSPDSIPDDREEMENSGYFDEVQVFRYLWYFDRTPEGYIELLNSYSDNLVRDPDERKRLFEGIRELIEQRPTKKIRKHYLSILRVGRKNS